MLRVDRKASPSEIKKAYHKIVQELHPDKYASKLSGQLKFKLEEIFNEINLAYRTLSDTKKRLEYDRTLMISKTTNEPLKVKTEVQVADAQYKKGLEALKNKEIIKAIEFFKSAISMNPNVAEYYAKLAFALMNIPKFRKDALEQCKIAIKKNPENANYYALMGRIYQKMNDPENALIYFKRALGWDPYNKVARAQLPVVKQQLRALNPTFKDKFYMFMDKLRSKLKPKPKKKPLRSKANYKSKRPKSRKK